MVREADRLLETRLGEAVAFEKFPRLAVGKPCEIGLDLCADRHEFRALRCGILSERCDMGVPFAFGGVAGRANARSPPSAAAIAPAMKMQGVESKFSMPRHFTPMMENTAEATHPSEPNTLICGKAAVVELDIAIAAVSDHDGM